jgi:Pyruvate/2-oxoacid:ferredoxin oxidoreductase delta subunit
MIFYFSATGNSQYVAEKLSEATGERRISIGVALRDGHFRYDVHKDRYLIFVLPTFAWTLPGAAARFLDQLELSGLSDVHVYGVFTCGESSGHESLALETMLKAKSLPFHGSFALVMPDNFILWSELPTSAELNKILSSADEALCTIIDRIVSNSYGTIGSGQPKDLFMPITQISSSAGTSKFYATERCTGCGICMDLCPMRCIKDRGDGRPVWDGECTMCLSCLHRCPEKAVEHGTDTQNKDRYSNPRVHPVTYNNY